MTSNERKSPLTDEEVEKIIDRRYFWSKLENTRKFLITKLKEDPNFKESTGLMVKQDIIDQYVKKRVSENLPIRNYDWSKVPEYITNNHEKFTLYCPDINLKGKIIGEYKTCYDYLVGSNQEPLDYSKLRNSQKVIQKQSKIFLEKFNKIHGDKYELLSEYKGRKQPITLRCKIHDHIFTTTPRNLLTKSDLTGNYSGWCPLCRKEYLHERSALTTEEFIQKAHLIHGYDTYDYSKVIYKNTVTEVEIIDKRTGKSFWQRPMNHLNGYGNNINNSSTSKGEIWIEEWLNSHNINHMRNVTIYSDNIGRKSDYVMIDFSFEINGEQYWIEYNGSQHYKYTSRFHNKREGEFFNQFSRDRNVVKYAKEHDITLLVIPYLYDKFYKIDRLLTDLLINKKPLSIIKMAKLVLPTGYNEYGEKI